MRFVRPPALGAMLLAVFLTAPIAGAQALDQVPGDALVVVRVKNLDQVSKKVATFAKGLGLDQQMPELGDPLTALADKAKMTKGLNRGGDMVIAMMDPEQFGGKPDQAVLMLIPTTDYKSFLTNFKAATDEGDGISKATPQDGPEDVFVANWGTYAALSPNKATLAKKPTGLKPTGFSAKELEAKDVVMFANIKAVRGKVLPEMKKNREQLLAQIQQGLEGEGAAKFVPVAKVAANQFLNVAEGFMRDAHSATVSLNLTEGGIGMTYAADFDPTSYAGKMALQNKPATGSLLAGLPDRKYFFFAGGASDPEQSAKAWGDLLDPVIKELAAVPEAAKFAKAMESMKKGAGATSGFALGYVAPTGALGQESVLQQVAVMRGDSKTIQSSQREMMGAMNDLMKMLPQQAGGQAGAMNFEYKPGARTVGGVQFDAFETKINFAEDDPQQQQAKQMLAFVYGPAGMTGVLGAVDPKTVVSVQGGDEKLISDAVTASKANADTLGAQAGVRAVGNELPKNRSMEAYLDLGTLVSTGTRYARGFGLPVNVKLPADLPPIGFSAGTDATAVRMDVHVPNRLVQGLMTAALDAQRQMQNQNNPGGGLE
ncbi:MAG: hypothetical protein AVDCRST_MAG64-1196 [uncultured Phycisphaerae bacterium]|uniref:DUF3352 domain-containing protein n=1 Tax=uncultured Phycisphaerae bacterium TaxID=904963 RepID=A0A6J4NLE5_9BACT|nr:MAG: hypothetical protein AVDCRST_MAG64-1196 [uncultured Phycisphaerae bacterium]